MDDLVITPMVASGTLLIHVKYGPVVTRRTDMFELLKAELESTFRTAMPITGAEWPRCGVLIQGDYEFDDLSLIRAIIGLWDAISRENGRLFIVGYPMVTESGRLTGLPPLLPGFALARDIDSGIRWASRPIHEMEGGDRWNYEPGVTRGRSLIPGERLLEESAEIDGDPFEREDE
jgi:hypothetical protein